MTVVLPAGVWHFVAMDEGVGAEGTAFFTVPGTVIEPFAIQMEIVARGRVRSRSCRWSIRTRSRARWSGPAWPTVPTAPSAGAERPSSEPAGEPPPADARILPYPEPRDGLTLPLDTGHDSLFIMSAAPAAETAAPAAVPVMLPLPDVVDVHRHPDVDEYIIRRDGAGYILNGRTQATVTLTPFRAPCVLVMPAGAFHRIVQTEDDQVGESDPDLRRPASRGRRYETIVARTATASISGPIRRTTG